MVVKFSFSLLILFLSAGTLAQDKPLTPEHYFKGNFTGIIDKLPAVLSWTDNSHFAIIRNGKTFIVDAKTGKETEQTGMLNPQSSKPSVILRGNTIFFINNGIDKRVTFDSAKKSNPTLSFDAKYVAFTKMNDLYTIDLNTQKENRLTFDGNDTILNGYASWLYMEEILGRTTNYKAFWWSPDSKSIAFFRCDDSDVPVFTITDGNGPHGYVETMRYPKVGDKNPEVKIGFVKPDGGAVTWADFNSKEDQYFGMPYWQPDSKRLLVQWLNRKQNELKFYSVDPLNGFKSMLYRENQKTWITLKESSRLKFLSDGRFLMLSDASGWMHINFHDEKGKLINAVTTGNYFVVEVNFLDEKNGIVYFTARKENSARRDLYKVSLNGKNLKKLTPGNYNNTTVSLSPDASYFVTTQSTVSSPVKISIVNNVGKIIRELADSKASDFDKYTLAKTEIILVKSDDGLFEMPMKVTWPVNMDKSKKYPVLISAYGGPNAGTVMDTWSLTASQQWYAKEGLIQVVMDHRGSGHFGKAGANYMYHDLGKWEITDYSTMVRWLVNNGNADPSRIAITGFSYGGFLTTYALTYGSDVFTHGMAGGSVTDWSLYDSHYTERFMGTKEDNKEGYEKSNVMNYIDKYKGVLQIVHGIMDDNVHLQNSLQLISALQDKQKEFEMMLYSGVRHGITGSKTKHYNNLKTRFIYKYLLHKEAPQEMLK